MKVGRSQHVLRQISYIGIAFGILEISYSLYAFSGDMSYEPIWGIGALIVSFYLLFRGDLQATGWVGDDALLLLIISSSLFLSTLVMRLFGLWIVHFRLYPVHAIYFFIFHIFLIIALGWIYKRLRSPDILEARRMDTHHQLRVVGNMQIIEVTPISVPERYPDHPSDRPDGYELFMVGPGGFDVLASAEITNSISTNIITNCSTVSMVAFSVYPEAYVTFGLVHNEVQEFECYEAYDLGLSSDPNPPWGYERCL